MELKYDTELILENLPIRKDILHRSLVGYPQHRIIEAYGFPVYNASLTTPITEEGRYVRISPLTTKAEWQNAFEFAQIQFDAENNLLEQEGIKKPSQSRNSTQKTLERHLEIERRLHESLNQKEHTLIEDEESEIKLKEMVEGLAEETGTSASTINDAYYRVLDNYNIPKLKSFEKIGSKIGSKTR